MKLLFSAAPPSSRLPDSSAFPWRAVFRHLHRMTDQTEIHCDVHFTSRLMIPESGGWAGRDRPRTASREEDDNVDLMHGELSALSVSP